MTLVRPSWALRTRVGLGVAALCLAAPTVQAAAAEDGAPLPASSDLAGAAVDAALETVSALSTAEPVLPAPAEVAPPETVTDAPAVPVIPPPAAATAAEPSQPAPTAASEAPVPTEPVSPDPAPDSAAATQLQPVNLNVSVRFDSPGDNGAVEQVNAAIAAVVGTPPGAGSGQYQPAESQYQPPQAPAQAPATASASPASAPSAPGWSWTWTCGGSVTDVLAAGGAGDLLPANWNWNWNWNCGEEGAPSGNNNTESNAQYHPGVTQYQPVNLNVSIRIGSPGNDGPVTQTNLSVLVVTPPVIVPPVVVSPLPIPLPTLPPATGSEPPAAALDLVFELGTVELSVAAEAADAVEWIFRGLAGPFGVDSASGRAGRDTVAARSLLAPAHEAPEITSLTVSSSALALRAAAVVHAQSSVRSDRPAHAKPKRNPFRRPAPPVRAPVLASGFAGTTPGGADGGGWPLLALLLVPFSLALVDSSRRMGRDAALPAAAEFITRRERPG